MIDHDMVDNTTGDTLSVQIWGFNNGKRMNVKSYL